MSVPTPAWPGELVELGSQRLFVRSASADGPAEPAVFVHGIASTAVDWTDLMGELRDVLAGDAVDLPGYGFSPPPPDGRYTLDAHARAVARLIETRDRGPVHLFGNSLGGAIAIRLAVRRPELVKTLTLISPGLPGTRLRALGALLSLLTMPGVGEPVARGLARVPAERRVRQRYKSDFYDVSCVHPERWAEAIAEAERYQQLDHAAATMAGTVRGIASAWSRRGVHSLWHQAAQIDKPTLLIWGTHDHLIDARLAVPASRAIRGSRVVLIPDCAHVAQLEKPKETAAEFRAFLDSCSVSSPREGR